jgi:hypothetical protein
MQNKQAVPVTGGRILNGAALTDHGHVEGRRLLLDILETGLRAADPYYAMHKAMRREGDLLYIGGGHFDPPASPKMGPEVIDLRHAGRI